MKYYQPQRPTVSTAFVTYSQSEELGVSGIGSARGVELYGPRGIQSLPCVGDKILLLQVDGGQRYLGTAYSSKGLKEGEVRLQSSGGGCIYLKEDGSISLNGLTITKDGVLLPVESP